MVIFLAVGCLISSVLRSVNQSTSVSLGLVFGFYLFGILGDLQEELSMFKKLLPMAQGGPANLIAQNFDFKLMILLTTVSILSLFVTIVIYKRKDLQI